MELTTEATLAQPRQGKIARFFILILFLTLLAHFYRTDVNMGSDLWVHLMLNLNLSHSMSFDEVNRAFCSNTARNKIVPNGTDLILGTFDEKIFLSRCGPPPPPTITTLAVLVITTTAATLTASRALGNISEFFDSTVFYTDV